MHKIRAIRFFFDNRLHWQFTVRLFLFTVCKKVKRKAHPHAGPEGSWRVKAPRFLDIGTIWLYVVSLTHRPGTHFHEGLSRPQGHGLIGRKYVTKKSSDTTGNRSRDRPTSSAAP
jgi:hypothetical protein